ncbi:MAG: hypothetical protein ACRDRT_05510 [Pseudonocardiaceae bacterium]
MTLTMNRAHDVAMGQSDPTPLERPRRRSFPADYKRKIIAEHDACNGDGDKGALLRREGLYSSQITEWRHARDAGALAGLTAKVPPTKTTHRAPRTA